MSSSFRSTLITLTIVGLVGFLVYLALKSEREYQESPTVERAPTAPPLRTLTERLERVAARQWLYVPVYSHVYSGRGGEIPLAVTLSIRNTDADQSIVIELLQYFDNDGQLLRDYLQAPIVLDPLASTDFLVEQRDMAGGVGANFLVNWAAEDPVSLPIVEAVMVSGEGNRAFSFVRSAYPIAAPESTVR